MEMAVVASGQITITDLNDTKQLVMYIGASQSKTVVFDGISSYTPDYSVNNQTLTPQLYVAGDSVDIAKSVSVCKWYYQINGANTPIEITADTEDYTLTPIGENGLKSLTIKTNLLVVNTSMTYICELIYLDSETGFNATIKSEIELIRASSASGKDAVIGVLTNEFSSVLAKTDGTVISYDGVSTEFNIYKGIIDDTANWTITQTRKNVIASEDISSNKATITNMSADTGSVTFTATKSGYPTISKVFRISKVKSGEDATSYNMNVSTTVLALNKTRDSFNPIDINVSATFQVGSYEPFDYPTIFAVDESIDGVNYVNKYISASDEYSFVYTPSSFDIKSIKVKMHLAGGTETILDEQVIPVVYDGADAIYVNVWTPDGNAIKNGTGTVTAKCDMYNGSKLSTASSYKWYIQDPTATPTNGGDNDGGDGWRKLTSSYNAGTSGYTTDKLTIPSSAIAGTEAFKCVVIYNGNLYSGVTTVVDLSDPIVVRLDGASSFKNGQGSVTIRATLLRGGEEIDSNGTTYTYTWSIYDSANNKTDFSATGKSITVNASAINGVGNLVCDVSKS